MVSSKPLRLSCVADDAESEPYFCRYLTAFVLEARKSKHARCKRNRKEGGEGGIVSLARLFDEIRV